MKNLEYAMILAALVLAGCGEDAVQSTDVSTLDMTISLDAEDEGSGAPISIRISSPLGYLRLSGGDTLRASMAGKPLDLREEDENGSPVYVANVDSLSDDIILDLERPTDQNIVGRIVDVPPPIMLSAEPIIGDSPLVLSWNAAPMGTHWLNMWIEGTCITPLSRHLPNDVGSYSILQAEFSKIDPNAPLSCPLIVTFTRSATIQEPLLPSATKLSLYAWIRVERSIEVSVAP